VKPRVLFVGRARYRLPLQASVRRKWDALRDQMDVRVLASGSGGDGTFRLVRLPGPLFYLALPVLTAREIRHFRPDAVVAQSAYEALAVLVARPLARRRPRLILEVHGDWRTLTRLYGSPARRLVAPVGDRLGAASVKRADAVRTISDYTSSLVRDLGREPTATFPTYSDLHLFAEPPVRELPQEPRALFVGVLERYKNVDGLAAAWRLVQEQLPDARLHVVGRGRERDAIDRLVGDVPGVEWDETLPPEGVVRALDRSVALLLPSNSEGLGRVVIEAFLRGRPVVGARVGGIPDLVRDGENGLLVDPRDPAAIAAATVRVLSDRALAERLGAEGRATAEDWLLGPEEFARRTRELVDRALA